MRGRGDREIIDLQPGLRAQALRYLDILAHEPLEIDMAPLAGRHCLIRVPHPATFIAQKVLARTSGRHLDSQPKDLAYIYDVVMLTIERWPEIGDCLDRAANQATEWKAWISKSRRMIRDLFSSETADGPIDVARIYRDHMGPRAPSEKAIARMMGDFATVICR
jgi:hypothetical protein